jgi:hypothetical protein
MATKARMLLDWGGCLRRFLRIEFRNGPNEDGSLLVVLDRSPKARWDAALGAFRAPNVAAGERPLMRFRLTYLATGRVNIHGTGDDTVRQIFAEPIFAVSAPLLLAMVSVPHPNALEPFVEKLEQFDHVMAISPHTLGRAAVAVTLHPDASADDPPAYRWEFRMPGWFRLLAAPAEFPPALNVLPAAGVWTVTPNAGPLAAQALDMNAALIFVHQKLTGSTDLVWYWAPYGQGKAGRFRAIFSVPMRKPPKVCVEFKDP